MDDLSYIIGMMRENTDAVGFIPETTLATRYLANEQYIIEQSRGKRVGYILHGKPTPGGRLTIAQTVIDYDWREQGFGQDAIQQIIERAKLANARCIDATVAEDLTAACHFFPSAGFELINVIAANNRRNRCKMVFRLDLWPKLF